MLVNLLGFTVEHVILNNVPAHDEISISYAFRYKCEFTEDGSGGKANGKLGIVVHSADSIDKIESASVLIDVEMRAGFDVFDSTDESAIEKETLRVLFPSAIAYIAQLTANANMAPLYVPNLSQEDIEKLYNKPEPKKNPKGRKPVSK